MGKNVGKALCAGTLSAEDIARLEIPCTPELVEGFRFMTGGTLGIVLWIVAAAMLVTGLVGFCPLYRLFGISTRSADQG